MITTLRTLIFLLAVLLTFVACRPDSAASPPATPRAAATVDPFSTFTEVQNDCGACGTNSPVGGWESEDGRALILDTDRGFTAFFNDGTTMTGTWEQSGSNLCLSPSTGGETCYRYQQRIDAMKLDDAIYIRQ